MGVGNVELGRSGARVVAGVANGAGGDGGRDGAQGGGGQRWCGREGVVIAEGVAGSMRSSQRRGRQRGGEVEAVAVVDAGEDDGVVAGAHTGGSDERTTVGWSHEDGGSVDGEDSVDARALVLAMEGSSSSVYREKEGNHKKNHPRYSLIQIIKGSFWKIIRGVEARSGHHGVVG